MAKLEDAWNKDLRKYCGLSKSSDSGPSWKTVPSIALGENMKMIQRHAERSNSMALEMYKIMEKERTLAKIEKSAGRDERHRRNKAKRLARREAEQCEKPGLAEPAGIMGSGDSNKGCDEG